MKEYWECKFFGLQAPSSYAETLDIPTQRLVSLLDMYLNERSIDFITFNVEGYEPAVLKNNNWGNQSPTAIGIKLNNNSAL